MDTTKIGFYGGVGSVTGANFLLQTQKGTKMLVDCGLVQGVGGDQENHRPFAYDPSSIDVLCVTHAHMDHIGRIPKLVREGFRGPIFSTIPTAEIVPLMFKDALSIMRSRAIDTGLEPLYDESDIEQALSQWKTFNYHEHVSVFSDISIYAKDAGHILGSAMIECSVDGKKILFTGDLGNSPSLLLPDTESIEGLDYVVMESVYGDRNHEGRGERSEKLFEALHTVLVRGGTALIPVFSIEKAQMLLYELNEMVEHKKLPSVPIFMDSPLATHVTEVYKNNSQYFNDHAKEQIRNGDDIFFFPRLEIIENARESYSIQNHKGPKIIIAGSGMSSGGRVVHHEKYVLPDPKNALILIGYQVLGTLGRRLKDGAKVVTIDDQKVKVKASVLSINGYSSHKDSDNLVDFVSGTQKTVKKVFCVMGETKSALHLVQRLRDFVGIQAFHPEEGELISLD